VEETNQQVRDISCIFQTVSYSENDV